MADPPTGAPEPLATTTTRRGTGIDASENLAPTTTVRTRRHTRVESEQTHAAPEPVELTNTGTGTGRVTTREIWQIIVRLQHTMEEQTTLIHATRSELREVKDNQNELQTQNEKLQEEILALRSQVDGLNTPSPTRSWAAVAAATDNPQPRETRRQTDKDKNCVRISTQRSVTEALGAENNGNAFGRYLPTPAANTHIRTALLKTPSTQDAQVAGIGTTKTGYVIRFKNQTSAEMARNNTEWLTELGNDTRLVKPRFGVAVHHIPTFGLDLENRKTEAIEKIANENDLTDRGFRIEDIAWLKKRDKELGTFASMGIWFDSLEAAEWMLNNGLLIDQRHGTFIAMLENNLRILQLNTMKSRAGMEALINDHQSQKLDVLLIQEPSITAYRTHVNHSAWRLYQPTVESDSVRFRSLIYVNRKLSTSSHRQVRCNHPDLTAVKIWTADSQILIFSVYIPPVPMHTPDGASAEATLSAIHDTIQNVTRDDSRTFSLILAGDFNRHHLAWGSNHIQPRFIEDAGELINFFHDHGLQSCLPRGTATFWSLSHPGRNSTIDQTVTNRPDLLIKCHLYHDNYGSDHRGTYSEWYLQARRNLTTKPRKAYDRADWEKIGKEIQVLFERPGELDSTKALDTVVDRLTRTTANAVDKHTPDLRPSPYSKRWFTADLNAQQNDVNRLRRKWQESCAEVGRADPRTMAMFEDMRQSRRAWTRTIEKAKTSHWKQFLDEAGEGKLWKAATYMKPRDSWGCIPALKVGDRELVDNAEKAQAFMGSFFPSMAPAQEEAPPHTPTEIRWHPISEVEVYRSLKAAKGTTAPGEDGLPTLIWKRLWKYLGNIITRIFTASIEQGYHPQRWRSARIVVLRKPGKPDYSLPGAYRPISLLNTLGKLLEAVMARRLSFFAEHYGLLPDTQFGGRPGRTTEQALLMLANAIDRAWYRQKVVTLVAFDLKGAFNGVNKTSLDIRLQSKGIPSVARTWIASFMSGRQASITPVDFHGGASAFIDDYFRWRVGWRAEENLAKIQSEDIPRIEAWARRTGSCFAAEKTELIHITRKRKEQSQGHLVMNGNTIKTSTTAKLLGVMFDHELRWKEHVQQAVKRATKVNIALGGLRQLRPEQMRQLYEACVTPVVDYASTVWHDPLRDKTHLRHLRTVQRAALIRVLSAFRTVATTTLDVEAHVLPTHLRLRYRAQNTITRLHTLPQKHPIWSALRRGQRRRNNRGSFARFPLSEALKTMNLERLQEIEMIDPTPLPPWRKEAFSEIEIESDRDIAIERAEAARSIADIVVYSGASGRENHLGAAAAALNDSLEIIDSIQMQVGPMDRWSVHAAELIGILYAINIINKVALRHWRTSHTRVRSATILSDSKSALQAVQNPGNKSGQQIIHAILQAARNTKTHGTSIRLQWTPGHCEVPGNDAADLLAKEAAVPGKTHPFCFLLSRERAHIRQGIHAQWKKEWNESSTGAYLRQIDDTLPAKYTRRLYGSLPRNRAYLLTQLRTGHCWLSTYAKTFRFRDDDLCVCGERESVHHVLLDCPRLRELRRELRIKVGDAFNSISTLLGGPGEEGRGNIDSASRTKTVEAVLDFAEASQRFQSRAP
ncbi:hypothetical protein CBS147333_10127 [Penicillium roqueforti]|nr:hypothetical protein CBS147333_10127 [Penicillium roqueforti]